jgi:hypothetical protein
MSKLWGTDKGISFDPLDDEIIEKLFKKDIGEGEEKLILAVLADAIDHFQKHVVAKDEKGKKLFQEAEEWFLEKDSDGLFSFEYVCDTLGVCAGVRGSQRPRSLTARCGDGAAQ